MEEEQQPPTTNQLSQTASRPKKVSSFFYVLLTLALMLGASMAVYYFMLNQQNDLKQNNQQSIAELQANLTKLNQDLAKVNSETPVTIDGQQTQQEIRSLVYFCYNDLDSTSIVANISYINNTNGKYGNCKYEEKDGSTLGWQKIGGYSNGKWSKLWAGSDSITMEQTYCTKYKIPTSFYIACKTN